MTLIDRAVFEGQTVEISCSSLTNAVSWQPRFWSGIHALTWPTRAYRGRRSWARVHCPAGE